MAEASSRVNPSAVDNAPSTTPTGIGFRRLRIWPAVVLLAVLWLAKALPLFTDELGMWGFMLIAWSPLVCAAGPLRYCPDSPLSRGQMAVFLVKAFSI